MGPHVHALERKIVRHRTGLVAIDATIRPYAPDLDPDSILPMRAYRRSIGIRLAWLAIQAAVSQLARFSNANVNGTSHLRSSNNIASLLEFGEGVAKFQDGADVVEAFE